MKALIFLAVVVACVHAMNPPLIPYQRVDHRVENPSYCQAEFAFCPNQTAPPVLDADDTVEVWALQAPIWEFKFGDLMAHFKGFHDAIGMKSIKTGKNFTMEWYELDQLGNCTFPHEISNASGTEELLWCNQGAACFYDGITDLHWSQNGSMHLVSHINGSQFNQLMAWQQKDNDTGIYYETWTVVQKWEDDPEKRQYVVGSFDCKDYVLRVFDALYSFGATFNQTAGAPKYTLMNLVAKSWEVVKFEDHREDMLKFYSRFQPHQSWVKNLEHLVEFLVEDLFWEHKFYLYYNQQYYLLKLHFPYIEPKYAEFPLPGYTLDGPKVL